MLPGTLLPGISETRQDDQGPFLRGMVVPEQPSSQEPHRGLSAQSIVRGPPARLRLRLQLQLQRWPERVEPGSAGGPAGRERWQEQGQRGDQSHSRYRDHRGSRAGGGGAGTPPGRGRQRCAVLGGGGGGRFPTRWPGLADPLVPVAVPRSRWQAVGSGAARGGGGRRGAPRRAAAAHGVQRGADQHPGELLPAAAVPGRGRAPAAGGQDAPVRGAGERWGRATALPNYRIDSPGRPRNLVFSLSSRSRPGFRTGG